MASESKTDRLVAWHDAYNEVFDYADPEGSIYAALEAADKAVPPPLPPATLPNTKRKPSKQPSSAEYERKLADIRKLPGRTPLWVHTLSAADYGDMKQSDDGYTVILRWKDLSVRMSRGEWDRQGCPSARTYFQNNPPERTPEEWIEAKQAFSDGTTFDDAVVAELQKGLISPNAARERLGMQPMDERYDGMFSY